MATNWQLYSGHRFLTILTRRCCRHLYIVHVLLMCCLCVANVLTTVTRRCCSCAAPLHFHPTFPTCPLREREKERERVY